MENNIIEYPESENNNIYDDNQNKEILSSFCRMLSNQIDNSELDNRQIKLIHEFLIFYKVKNYLHENQCDISEDDMIQFLMLGLYLYKIAKIFE